MRRAPLLSVALKFSGSGSIDAHARVCTTDSCDFFLSE